MVKISNLATGLLVAVPAAIAKPVVVRDDVHWSLTDINYSSSMVYSTPAHLATYGGLIQFNLTSTAVPYITRCSARGLHLQDFFYGELNYTCENPIGSTGVTNFTFSRPDNSFTVNQTWLDLGGSHLGKGAGKANLACQTSQWTNPNWTSGQLYSTTTTTCQPTQLEFTPTVENTNTYA